ncbi:hypothetical protein [Plantactinospora veratri]
MTTVADQNQLPPWLAATRPDVVLMHFGTNDVWSNGPPPPSSPRTGSWWTRCGPATRR